MRRQEGQPARKVAIEREPAGGVEMMVDVPCGPGRYLRGSGMRWHRNQERFQSLGLP